MFHFGSFLDDHKKRHSEYTYYICFKKFNRSKYFYIEDGQVFIRLMSLLKKYCILINFNSNYEIIEFLGSGHFAEVFSVKNRATEQIFAAKIFQKTNEKFLKNQVDKLYRHNLIYFEFFSLVFY